MSTIIEFFNDKTGSFQSEKICLHSHKVNCIPNKEYNRTLYVRHIEEKLPEDAFWIFCMNNIALIDWLMYIRFNQRVQDNQCIRYFVN